MTDPVAPPTKVNLILAIVVVIFAALVVFVWIPIDVESGIFEKVRRRYEIGDAFAPTLAVGLLGVGGLMLLVESLQFSSTVSLSLRSLKFVAVLLASFAAFTSLLVWTGPLLVSLIADTGSEYRLLRDTIPWKYSGYLVGGTFLISALISLMEHRVRWQSVAIAVTAVVAMILLYDLPFDDLLLPPNGDY